MDLLTPDFGLIFWQTVTLLVVLWVLKKFAWKPILDAIEAREQRISNALQAAQRAETALQSLEQEKLAQQKATRLECDRILAEALQAKRDLMQEARATVDHSTQEMLRQSKVAAQQERDLIMADLKDSLAELSVDVAQKILQQELQHRDSQEAFARRLVETDKRICHEQTAGTPSAPLS